MVTALRLGLMVLGTMASTCKERNMAKVNSLGPMAARIRASLLRITYKAKESIIGQTADSMTASGSIIRWRGTACSPGPTADATKAPTLTTKRKVRVTFTGLMVVNMRVVGRMESSMVLALILLRVVRLSRVSGPTEKDSTGFPILRVSNE